MGKSTLSFFERTISNLRQFQKKNEVISILMTYVISTWLNFYCKYLVLSMATAKSKHFYQFFKKTLSLIASAVNNGSNIAKLIILSVYAKQRHPGRAAVEAASR